jgi:hypothetical protein
MGGECGLDREAERNMALERAERGQGSDEGSGEGRCSGQGMKGAGMGRRRAGRGKARKKPHLVRDAARVGGWVGLVAVESAISANAVSE